MRNLLYFVLFSFTVFILSNAAGGTTTPYEMEDDILVLDEDTIVYDTIVWDAVVYDTVEWDEVAVELFDDGDSAVSSVTEDISLLCDDKKQEFEYVTSEGSVFQFLVNPDDVSVTLEKGQGRNVKELIIPNRVSGLGKHFLVTTIADFAFWDRRVENGVPPMEGVKRLVLSEGIESVGQNCFESAEDLEEVILPASLENLGYCAFSSCPKLKSVLIPLESKLSVIEDFVFMDCPSLEAFYIPASVEKIGQAPWRNCKVLSELKIADNNYNFNVYDNVLYSGDRTQLIQYPAGKKDKEYHVNFGTQTIDNSSFYGNDYITKVTFPVSLDSISHIAFYGCEKLDEVVFTDRIEFIGNAAFGRCPNLKTIQLYGTPEYTYDGEEDPYNTFEPYTQINITYNSPNPNVVKNKGSILERVWLTAAELPYFQEVDITNNEAYGFPSYLGMGKAVVYGNAAPKEDILRLLDVIPQKLLAYEDIDEKGRITRFYVDYGKRQTLYFIGGIGGNDLVIALFNGGDKKKIKELMNELNN